MRVVSDEMRWLVGCRVSIYSTTKEERGDTVFFGVEWKGGCLLKEIYLFTYLFACLLA
jgi:hypothetical protein